MMIQRLWPALAVSLLLPACQSVGDAANSAIGALNDLAKKTSALGTGPSVRGRVVLNDGQTLTCFAGIPTGYLGPADLASPGWSTYDKATGKATLHTAAIPAAVLTRSGTFIDNNCDKLAAEGLLVAPETVSQGTSTGGRPADYRSFKTSEVYHLFDKFPQPGGGESIAWPRLVITLADAPAWGWERRARYPVKAPGVGCWTFTAKLWDSETQSRDIAPFHVCSDEVPQLRSIDTVAHYENWSGLSGLHSAFPTRGSTGITRTDGPVWPDSPLPVAKQAMTGYLSRGTFTGEAVAGLLYATAIDFRLEDHRVWLNLAPQTEPVLR